ncbi:MAG TPA: hypothetical protein VD862_01445 [Candidatus Paceibacterota bacterium]|nr:hypothetical protein [Candidatus Paceibacterota bacterium]
MHTKKDGPSWGRPVLLFRLPAVVRALIGTGLRFCGIQRMYAGIPLS